nr:class I SAM-dependent methyltransferase [uncultured Desulfobacter sp.]
MEKIKQIFNSEHANAYDQKAMKAQWLDPAIVFGMAYRFVSPKERVLDIGIGTGLSSELFFKAGLEIHGIDFSHQMLGLCRAKGMAKDLKEHDLSVTPYPYPDNFAHHAVCTGVTHIFEDITPIFKEVSRMLKENGMFAFVVAHCDEGEKRTRSVKPHADPQKENMLMYGYCDKQIEMLTKEHGFGPVYDLEFNACAIANQPGRYKARVIQKQPVTPCQS